MVEPVAKIRPVTLADQKLIRFMVGKAEMEPIAIANDRRKSCDPGGSSYYLVLTPYTSILESARPRAMARLILRLHRVYELVAQARTWCLRIPQSSPCFWYTGNSFHVRDRLVCGHFVHMMSYILILHGAG